MPKDGKIAKIKWPKNDIISITRISERRIRQPTRQPRDIDRKIQRKRYLANEIEVTDTISIKNSIVKGMARAISDGSYKDGIGTSSFIIDREGNGAICRVNRMTGRKEDGSTYRSELFSVTGILNVVKEICNHYKIKKNRIGQKNIP